MVGERYRDSARFGVPLAVRMGAGHVRKVSGALSTWRITSPLKHWLSTLPWLADGTGSERPLSERWLVPISLLQGQQEPVSSSATTDDRDGSQPRRQSELAATLKGLGLNEYPTDGERIGPELLNALAAAWRALPELAASFNVFLGQVRHAWHHFDERRALPDEFLVWTGTRRFGGVDGGGLREVYLPDDAQKGRTVRESGKGVLEMQVRDATRLAALLAETTSIRRASALRNGF